jgi:GT2 family glycosyltransferase
VSVISLTYNRKQQIARLLATMEQQDYKLFEVVVVDNASTDGTSVLIETRFPHVRMVRVPENMGTYSYSFGIQAARGTYLLIMDDDGLPGSCDWISRVVARFEGNPRLGAVACTVRMYDTGAIAHDSPQSAPLGSRPESGYPCAAYNGTGAGLRAEAVKNVMPIYPRAYFRSWVELYLCTNLLRSGWQVRHFPDIEVWHCRSSESSYPSLSYYGLRNYYWYILQFYPFPHWLTEALHHFASGTKSIFEGRIGLDLFLTATRDAMVGFSSILEARSPISHGLHNHLTGIRRYGNRHGIVPMIPMHSRPY